MNFYNWLGLFFLGIIGLLFCGFFMFVSKSNLDFIIVIQNMTHKLIFGEEAAIFSEASNSIYIQKCRPIRKILRNNCLVFFEDYRESFVYGDICR